ncbi:hypothetical protein ACFPOE_23700 [Caenimonas terrae]|uniref:DUF4175 domain-containing protein n=1 Tax=Caenimonas terrae TaxID=696074 RepID=A0ABW0NKW4_9BURK
MHRIRTVGFLAIAAAAGTTVWFVSALKPTSPAAFLFFAAWLVSPYAAMVAVLVARKGVAPVHWHVVAVAVSIGGVLYLANAIFWHTDAQGALAVVMAPLLQGMALAVLLPLSGWAFRRTQNRQP